jgi:hypothetical protein
MSVVRALRDIFGKQNAFSTPWVGSPRMNRWGLHGARIAVTDGALQLRRLHVKLQGAPAELATLEREGVLVVPDFLPAAELEAVRSEAHRLRALAAARRAEPRVATTRGFGPKLPFEGGFDRFDGGTLNRFFDIDAATAPALHAAVRSERLATLCRAAVGFPHQPRRFSLYLTIAGDERQNPDPQRTLHRDTFHSTVKLWLFLDDVAAQDGPFEYVHGSHRMSWARYRWEHHKALAAVASRGGGSFRIGLQELPTLGLPEPTAHPVRANTLVLADTRGFHRRGAGTPGATRLALYANLRIRPFSPLPLAAR